MGAEGSGLVDGGSGWGGGSRGRGGCGWSVLEGLVALGWRMGGWAAVMAVRMSLCFFRLIVLLEGLWGVGGWKYLLLTRLASISPTALPSRVLFVPCEALVAELFVSSGIESKVLVASPCREAMDVLNCSSAICAVVSHLSS